MENKPLVVKVSIGILLMLLVVVSVTLPVNNNIETIVGISQRVNNLRLPTSMASQKMQNALNESLAHLRGWMLTNDQKYKQDRARVWRTSIANPLKDMGILSKNWTNPDNIKRLNEIKTELKKLKQYQYEIEDIANTDKNTPALVVLKKEIFPSAQMMLESITNMINLEYMAKATNERKQLLKHMADFRGSMARALSDLNMYVLSGSAEYQKRYEKQWGINNDSLRQMGKSRRLMNSEQKEHFSSLLSMREIFEPLPFKVMDIVKTEEANLAILWLRKNAAPSAEKIRIKLNLMVSDQQKLLTEDFQYSQQNVESLKTSVFVLFSGAAISIVLVGLYIYRWLLSSENEELQIALIEDQNWLTTHYSDMVLKVQGIKESREFFEVILNELAPSVDAQLALAYIKEEDEKGETVMSLCSSYAYQKTKHIPTTFSLGESLVGQCALDAKTICLSDVPDDYIKIVSGSGVTVPKNIIVFPIEFEGQLLAVVEIASFELSSVLHRALISQVEQSIGVVLNNILTYLRTEDLLRQSKDQAEELQAQQEELLATNADIKRQAANFERSE